MRLPCVFIRTGSQEGGLVGREGLGYPVENGTVGII